MRANVTFENYKIPFKTKAKSPLDGHVIKSNKDNFESRKTTILFPKKNLKSNLKTNNTKYDYQHKRFPLIDDKKNKSIKKLFRILIDFKTNKPFFFQILFINKAKKAIKITNLAASLNTKNNTIIGFFTKSKYNNNYKILTHNSLTISRVKKLSELITMNTYWINNYPLHLNLSTVTKRMNNNISTLENTNYLIIYISLIAIKNGIKNYNYHHKHK